MDIQAIVDSITTELKDNAQQEVNDLSVAADIYVRLIELHGLKDNSRIERIFWNIRRIKDRFDGRVPYNGV